jgi:hypothetical protein
MKENEGGVNLTKVHAKHVWKGHNKNPMYSYYVNKMLKHDLDEFSQEICSLVGAQEPLRSTM